MKNEHIIMAGTAFPAAIGKSSTVKTLGDISDFTGAPQRVKTLAERDALPYELRKWHITTCYVEDNSPAGDGTGTEEWFRLDKVNPADIMDPINWQSENESAESIIRSLPTFQINNTPGTFDAAYQKGQTVKHVVEEGGPIRLFEALLAFSGINNPAPTGLETDTNWKEVSPATLTSTVPITIPYNQEGGSGPFRHKQGDVIRQWDGSGTNNSRFYVRTGKAYPNGQKISPAKDFYEEYWEAFGEYGVTPQKTLYWFTDAPKAGTFLRQGSPVYTPGQVMPIVTTAPQEFPGRAVLNVERCDNTKLAQMPCIGLVENGMDPGKVGRVISQGILTTGLGSWPVGTKLYVGVNGGLTDVRPVAPNVIQQVAIVLGQAATSCMILVDVKSPEVVISATAALPVASPFASPFIADNGATVIQEVKAIGSAALQVLGTQVANYGTAANFIGYNNYFGKYVKFASAASFNSMAGCVYVNGQIQPVLVHTKAAASFALASTSDYTRDTRIFVGLCAGVPLTGPDGFRVLAGITYDSAQDSGWMVWLQYTDVETTNMLWKVRVPLLDQNGVQIPVKANTHYDMQLDFHGEKPAGQRTFDLKLTSYEVAGSSPNFTFTTRVGTHHEDNFQTTPVYNGFYQLTGMQAITLTTAAVSKEMMIRRLVTAYDADFSRNT